LVVRFQVAAQVRVRSDLDTRRGQGGGDGEPALLRKINPKTKGGETTLTQSEFERSSVLVPPAENQYARAEEASQVVYLTVW
jgi:hypothetical protein